MIFLYVYAAVAIGGLLSLPAYGKWYSSTHTSKGGMAVRRRKDYEEEPVSWDHVDYSGTRDVRYVYGDPVSLAAISFLYCLIWPLALSYLASRTTIRALSFPAKFFIPKHLIEPPTPKDTYIEQGHKEVDKLLGQ